MTYSKRIDKNKLFRALMIFTILVFILLQLTTPSVSSYVSETEREYKTVVVCSGDTLWSIASKYNTSGDIREKMEDIRSFNGLKSDALVIGDHIKVPLYD